MTTKCASCDHENSPPAAQCARCGAALATVPAADGAAQALADRIAPLIANGQLIEAVKRYRVATGSSLAEAKSAVEQLRDRGQLPPRPPAKSIQLKPEYESALLELLRSGKAIDAIRLYRDQTGAGLKDSRLAIEAIARQHQIPVKLSGCLPQLLLVIVLVIGIVVAGVLFFWKSP